MASYAELSTEMMSARVAVCDSLSMLYSGQDARSENAAVYDVLADTLLDGQTTQDQCPVPSHMRQEILKTVVTLTAEGAITRRAASRCLQIMNIDPPVVQDQLPFAEPAYEVLALFAA